MSDEWALGSLARRRAASESFEVSRQSEPRPEVLASSPEGEPPASEDAPPPGGATELAPAGSPDEPRAAPATGQLSSVERVAARESFSPDEPLPAFTFPVIDDATKEEMLRRVEQAQGAAAEPPLAASPKPEAPVGPLEPPGSAASPGSARRPPLDWRAWSANVSRQVRRWIETACDVIDGSRSRLPEAIRRPLSRVPPGAILATLAVLACAVIAGGLSLVTTSGEEKEEARPSKASPPPPKDDPVPRAIDEAKKGGLVALAKLTDRFPKDARVWLSLAAGHSERAGHAAAIEAVDRALSVDPEAHEDPRAAEVLAIAVRHRGTTDAAFELLRGPMGSAGATVLYDLSVDPQVELPLRSRATKWVRSDAFKKVADTDVGLAGALRYAASCSERHDLLPVAAEKGGTRVLDFLKVARRTVGCGRRARDDCFPCLRKDDALEDAIVALEQRLAQK